MNYEQAAKKHGFEIIRQIEAVSAPGVYLAKRGKTFFVLKSSEDRWRERAALKVWSGSAAATFEDLGDISALEYLSGRTPFYWGDDDLPKLIRMFKKMEKNQPQDLSTFPPLSQLVDIIKKDLEESNLAYRQEAIASLLKASDKASRSQEQLIHGDLHPWNIFMRDRATLIDPYGLRGDPGFDLAFLAAAVAHDQEEFLEKMNKELEYEHAKSWFPAMVARRLNNTLRFQQKSESRIVEKLAKRLWE